MRGLRLLSPSLRDLKDFPYSAAQQVQEAAARADKMSIQGVQPKLSAVLVPSEGTFRVVDTGGRYILKPQHAAYPQLPENEDLTMRLAESAGIDVPLHGLIRCVDGTLTYFIKRFDRRGRSGKLAVEDFSQLSGASRDTKYDSSMERVVKVIDAFCTFPVIEKERLFVRSLFCFLTGNEDMHLKNFSLVRGEARVELSPAYDLVNTTIVLPSGAEEVALPLRGKRRGLSREDWLDYWGMERLRLPRRVVQRNQDTLARSLPAMQALVAISFLDRRMRERYSALLHARARLLGLSA